MKVTINICKCIWKYKQPNVYKHVGAKLVFNVLKERLQMVLCVVKQVSDINIWAFHLSYDFKLFWADVRYSISVHPLNKHILAHCTFFVNYMSQMILFLIVLNLSYISSHFFVLKNKTFGTFWILIQNISFMFFPYWTIDLSSGVQISDINPYK